MEKYVIDLDKVLDDLELNDNENLTKNDKVQKIHQSSTDLENLYDKLDFKDADFSIQTKPPKILETIPVVNTLKECVKDGEASQVDSHPACQQFEINDINMTLTDDTLVETEMNHSNDDSILKGKESIDCTLSSFEETKDVFDNTVIEVKTTDNTSDVVVNQDIDNYEAQESHQNNVSLSNLEKQVENFKTDNVNNCDTIVVESINSLDNNIAQDGEIIIDDKSCVNTQQTNEFVQNDNSTDSIIKKDFSRDQVIDLPASNGDILEETTVESSKAEIFQASNVDIQQKEFSFIKETSEMIIENPAEIDINNMSETELDHYLKDLEENENCEVSDEMFSSQNKHLVSEVSDCCNMNETTEESISEFQDQANQEDMAMEEETTNIIITDETESSKNAPEFNSSTEQNNGLDRPENLDLQNVAEIVVNGPTTSHVDGRGSLVQNIAYFERQEMPNGLTEEEQMLGKVKPFWIPDEDAQNCLHCDSKFTLIKRRHHCRSCGKVLCSQCCNYKAKLAYLENKEARVCQLCYVILIRIEEIERMNGHPIEIGDGDRSTTPVNNSLTISFPDPNNPAEYCSTVSPFEQASEVCNMPPPTVMVPVGVLKRPGSSSIRRNNANLSDSSQNESLRDTVKQVMFSDGVRPGGDLVESPSSACLPEEKPICRTQLQLKSPPVEKNSISLQQTTKKMKPTRVVVADNKGHNLPPIINYNEFKLINSSLPSKPTYSQLIECLRNPHMPWVVLGLTKNLFINVKLISKLCCNSAECWTFSSKGLASVGQDEILVALDCDSLRNPLNTDLFEEDLAKRSECTLPEFPRDILRLFTSVYDSASKASLYVELSHIYYPDGLFGSKENSGFLFVRPTLQCFQNILVPSPPFLVALLIHKWEIPWAKVFPLRLVFRLGYEYKVYPTPVISFVNRKSAFFEIGHTIMNVLADFRNFQYTLSVVKDLLIHVEDRKRVSLLIPKLSYEKVCKVLSTSNEHVLAFGGNLSLKADSHFVCVQNEEDDDVHGQYQTQMISFSCSPQQVTGASFIVFSGALKSSTGLKAKMNIVEDGLLVQIPPSSMEELRAALRDMKDFRIDCCKMNESNSSEEWVQLNWVNEELSTNLGVRSQIDNLNLEGVQSARIFSSPDYANERYLIRWIEVFLLQINENSRRSEMLNTNRLAESIAQAFCVALIDHLDHLYESGLTKISLRISLDVDKVGYEAGSAGQPLPPQFTVPLDNALIPVIMENISTTGIEDPLVIELLFYILLK